MESRGRWVVTEGAQGLGLEGLEGQGGLGEGQEGVGRGGAGRDPQRWRPHQGSQRPREGLGPLSTRSFLLTREGQGASQGMTSGNPTHTQEGRRCPHPHARRGNQGLALPRATGPAELGSRPAESRAPALSRRPLPLSELRAQAKAPTLLTGLRSSLCNRGAADASGSSRTR